VLLALAPAAWSADAALKPAPKHAIAPAAAAKPTPAAPTEASALTAQGQRTSGEPRFSAGAIALGAASIAIESLVALDLPGDRPGWIDQGVLLADGQLLRGVPRSLQQDKLDFASDLLGDRSLAADSIAAIAFGPVPAADPLAGTDGSPGVILANGDRVDGKIAFINDKEVGVDTGRRIAQVPRARIRLICLRAIAPAAGLWLRTGGSDRLRAAAGADGFTVQLGGGDPVKLPLAAVRVAWSEGAQLTPLERLAPASVQRLPEFDEDIAVTVDRFRDGAPLAIGAQRFERGLASRAGCEAVWTQLGGASSLVGEVGVADGPGAAICRVVVDGKVAFDSGALAGGATPRPFSVPISGAKELRLVAVPANGGDTAGARVVWGWPTLVK
jgi:hypothetical protein